MTDYMEGWYDRKDVAIPPVEYKGFTENVIIRKKVEALTADADKNEAKEMLEQDRHKAVRLEKSHIEDGGSNAGLKSALAQERTADAREMSESTWIQETGAEEEYTGEDATVMLERPLKWRAYVRRANTAEEMEITKSPFVIGKSVECDFVIRDNMTISRRHAQIVTTSEGYMLEDLGSSNHTFIENIQINGPEKLKDRTAFQLSEEEFQFFLEIG